MSVKINFDASLGQKTSGACFEIVARDQEHARQIAVWLRGVCASGDHGPYIYATQTLDPQSVKIEV